MSGASSSSSGGKTYDTSLSDAYAKAGASASQVQAIRNQEISYQNSQSSGSGGGGTNASSLYPKATATVNPLTGVNNNNYFNGGGYAYNDKYGISHVVDDYGTALKYSGDGNVQSYKGAFGGGYALDKSGNAMSLPGATYNSPNLVGYDSTYGKLSALAPVTNVATNLVPSPAKATDLMPLPVKSSDSVIAGFQTLWQQKMAAGDIAGAENIHQQANQYRNSLGLVPGVDYDVISGASLKSLTPTPIAKADLLPSNPVAQITAMLDDIKMPQAPVYTPYQQQAFSYTAPSYSITANPADTSFIPTAKAKDRWQQQEQANADEAYKGYSSQYNAYQQGYKATQDAIANALSLLPFSEMTAAQKATIEQQQAQDALQYEIDKAKAEIEAGKWANTDEYAQLQANLLKAQTQKALRDANAPYSTGGSGPKTPKPTQSDNISAFMKSARQYRTAADYKADLQRYKADLIQYVGTSGWNYLYKDADAMVKAGNTVNPNFIPGTQSPIKAMLDG